jgi:hypothetical protein
MTQLPTGDIYKGGIRGLSFVFETWPLEVPVSLREPGLATINWRTPHDLPVQVQTCFAENRCLL